MPIINLTAHPIVVLTDKGELRLPPAELPLRSQSRRLEVDKVIHDDHHVPIHTVFESTCDVSPPVIEGTCYVTSGWTAEALERDDILFPIDLVRDEKGRVVACRGLARKF